MLSQCNYKIYSIRCCNLVHTCVSKSICRIICKTSTQPWSFNVATEFRYNPLDSFFVIRPDIFMITACAILPLWDGTPAGKECISPRQRVSSEPLHECFLNTLAAGALAEGVASDCKLTLFPQSHIAANIVIFSGFQGYTWELDCSLRIITALTYY